MDPIESLNIVAGFLQRVALPWISDNGQMSHDVIRQHLANIIQALETKPKTDDSLKEFNDWCEELYTLNAMDPETQPIAAQAEAARECVTKFHLQRGE
jgi:hypothetical protein